ncbi:claudin-8-like [Betta splendens]|uniref:Claudin-8-like n=1 Tax=Betta splendens TaxID=158456 RepID=A0A6P7PG25_BETSP|nr:claudin-8-like [Betta splendens]
MVHGLSEIAAVCAGLIGLIGASAATGLPMWKVTAFIGENIIVMETRWEGLWMNCFRQANIRMQCKVYDSLLALPAELQAARGLMCCSVALSGLGLLLALAGMRCTRLVQANHRAKSIALVAAGGTQLLACACVLVPVSWTGHVIIRDFYDPLLIDAQRRELGQALYIGWVSGAVLFASAVLFLCRHVPPETFNVHPRHNLLSYGPASWESAQMTYRPMSNISSIRSIGYQPSLQNYGSQRPLPPVPQVVSYDPAAYNPGLMDNALVHHMSVGHRSSVRSSNRAGSLYGPGRSLHTSQTPHSPSYVADPSASYQSSFHPVPQTPVFITYKSSIVQPDGENGSSAGVYI